MLLGCIDCDNLSFLFVITHFKCQLLSLTRFLFTLIITKSFYLQQLRSSVMTDGQLSIHEAWSLINYSWLNSYFMYSTPIRAKWKWSKRTGWGWELVSVTAMTNWCMENKQTRECRKDSIVLHCCRLGLLGTLNELLLSHLLHHIGLYTSQLNVINFCIISHSLMFIVFLCSTFLSSLSTSSWWRSLRLLLLEVSCYKLSSFSSSSPHKSLYIYIQYLQYRQYIDR